MPIFRDKWYSRKKPTLQIKILKSIVLNGQLSKRKASDMLDAYYSDVSDAIKALLERKLIKKSHIDFKSRRAEKYYTLTVNGLKALLEEDLTPKEFWSTMMRLCSISKIQISKSEFQKYYHLFEYKYLGHSAIQGYFFQSHFFDKILSKWLEDNSTLNPSIVSLSQTVIECIAINRAITLKQLVQKTSASEEDVKKVLDHYTMKLDYSSAYYDPIARLGKAKVPGLIVN
jgi:DNA-binding PadR family transcriptional regulator